MKKLCIFFIIFCFGMISGCSYLSSVNKILPFGEDTKEEKAEKESKKTSSLMTQGDEKFYISPQVKFYAAESKKYLNDSGEFFDPHEALKYLDAANTLDPLDNDIRLLRCQALAEGGYFEEAFNEATKVIRIEPSAKAYAVRGLVSVQSHERKGALRDFSYAEKLDPKESLVPLFRSRLYFSDNDKNKGCRELEKVCSFGNCKPLEKAKQDKICE